MQTRLRADIPLAHPSPRRHRTLRLLCALALLAFAGAASAVAYRGVNLAGAEFKSSKVPGVHGKDYTYPKPSDLDYFLDRGMNTFRLPFSWERLQPKLGEALDRAEAARLDAFVKAATAKGAYIVLDPHNYARYRVQRNVAGKKQDGDKPRKGVIGSEIDAAHFADLWRRLAERYKRNPRVIFGLMNEPHGLPAAQWLRAANAAIAAIRKAGANNLVLVPGTAWTGAHSWSKRSSGAKDLGASNASVMTGIVDPRKHYAFEVHQFLDKDSSGTSDRCVDGTVGSRRLAGFTAWLRAHGERGFLGEFAGGRNATCLAALDDMLAHIDENADVWLGWTYWAAGPWWGDYMFTLQPTGCPDCVDRPQMAPLRKYLNDRSAKSR